MLQSLQLHLVRKRFFARQNVLPVEIAVHHGNGGGIVIKRLNQGRDFGDPCLFCGVKTAVAAHDFVFIFAVF